MVVYDSLVPSGKRCCSHFRSGCDEISAGLGRWISGKVSVVGEGVGEEPDLLR